MTFPSWRALIASIIGWCVILFGADFILDPKAAISDNKAEVANDASMQTAHVRIWLRYPCRNTNCLPAVSDVIDDIEWLGPPKLVDYKSIVQELAQAPEGADAYEVESVLTVNRVEAQVTNTKAVDFMEILRSLESIGLVPDRIEYFAPGHYTVDARVAAVLDGASRSDAVLAVDSVLMDATSAVNHLVSEYRHRGYYSWFDSVGVGTSSPGAIGVDPVAGALRFYPELGARVDIMEILNGLAQIGLKPSSITLGTEAPR
ncbi:MAG: hypothetical protein R3F61_23620 [Myxococcota bacterium]